MERRSSARLAVVLSHIKEVSRWDTSSSHLLQSSCSSAARVPPMLRGNYAPVRAEVEASKSTLKVVAGALPPGLSGTYVRNGSNPQFDITGPYHWFDGDGMLHALEIHVDDNGNVEVLRYRNRYVKTERLVSDALNGVSSAPIGEMMAGRFEGMLKTLYEVPDGEQDFGLTRGTANTSVVHHNGQLLALHEGDMPYSVDFNSMDTHGRLNFGGQLKHRMTAHPTVDPETKELIFFGANQVPGNGPWMHYSVADANGNLLVANVPITLRGPQIMHDIAITQHFSVILDFPLFMRPGSASPYVHDLQSPARFGLIPRHAHSEKEMRWFETTSCFCYHVANAWEHGNIVSIVGCRSPHMDQGLGSSVWHLHRWDLDLATGTVSEEELSSVQCEFCVVDSNKVGRYSRFIYAARFTDQAPRMTKKPAFNGIVKFDLETSVLTEHIFEGCLEAGEAVFASLGPSAGDEDSGVLLTFAFDASSGNSELYAVNARDMSCQARVLLLQRVPHGFHGTWIPGTCP